MDDRSIVALYLRRDETAIRQTAEKPDSTTTVVGLRTETCSSIVVRHRYLESDSYLSTNPMKKSFELTLGSSLSRYNVRSCATASRIAAFSKPKSSRHEPFRL